MAWTDEFGLDIDVLDFPPGYSITSSSPSDLDIKDESGKTVVSINLLLPVGRASAETFGHLLERLAWKAWVKPEIQIPILKFGLAQSERPARNVVGPFLVRAGACVLAAAISIIVLRGFSLDHARVDMPRLLTEEAKTEPAAPQPSPRKVRLPSALEGGMRPALVLNRPQKPKSFRVSFGQFRRREFAEAQARLIRRMGYVPVVSRNGAWFVVLSRAYKARRDAEQWARIYTTIGLRVRVVAMRERSGRESLD